MLIGLARHAAPARRALQKAELHQIRLVNVQQCHRLFPDRRRQRFQPYRAAAISDVSHMACVGNDYGYQHVFSRGVAAMGRKGDVLLAITTSGTSANVVEAARAAKERGMHVIALTGRAGSAITELADLSIVTPAGRWADRVQELHIKVIHILIELVERELDPQNYEAK